MFKYNHITALALSLLVHVAGFLLIGFLLKRAHQIYVPPVIDLSAVELALVEYDQESSETASSSVEQHSVEIVRVSLPPERATPPMPESSVPEREIPLPDDRLEASDLSDPLIKGRVVILQPEYRKENLPELEFAQLPEPLLPEMRMKERSVPEAAAKADAESGNQEQETAEESAALAVISSDGGGATGRVDAQPSLYQQIKPVYPLGARRRGEEGSVVIEAVVEAHGRVSSLNLLSSSGFADLDRAATVAVRRARFHPGKRENRAVRSVVRLTLVFQLKK